MIDLPIDPKAKEIADFFNEILETYEPAFKVYVECLEVLDPRRRSIRVTERTDNHDHPTCHHPNRHHPTGAHDHQRARRGHCAGAGRVRPPDRHRYGWRRASSILAGLDLDAPVSTLIASKPASSRPYPIVAPAGTSQEVILMLMSEWHVRQVPSWTQPGASLRWRR